ncbi:MAG: DUF4340 domain-containing protein, partial [Deltaproteobacteria bacterium]|nr:DUF4340 domain-containing protein [Deltaproteobacteria bacterium]
MNHTSFHLLKRCIQITFASHIRHTSKSFFDLRDKTILNFAREEILEVKVQSKQKLNFATRKNQDGQWILQAPARVHAQTDKIDDILRDVDNLRAAVFEKEQPEQR